MKDTIEFFFIILRGFCMLRLTIIVSILFRRVIFIVVIVVVIITGWLLFMHRRIIWISLTSGICIRSTLLLILVKPLLILSIFLMIASVVVWVVIFISEVLIT